MAEASKAKSSTKTAKTVSSAATKKPVKKATKKVESKTSQTKVKKSAKVSVVKAKEIKDGTIQEVDKTASQTSSQREQVKEKTAKAGKRSEKALKEVAEKEAKEARKTTAKEETAEEAPRQAVKIVRSKLERRSKKYRKQIEQIDKTKQYSLAEAAELACKTSPVKFDASVELHVRLGVDPKQADQNLRDTVVLPAGTGKTVRVAVFAEPEAVEKAKKAGADIAQGDEFLQSLDKGVINFDILIATPSQMAKLGKYARVLGPKGLMPNPKSGTVTNDVAKAVMQAKAGQVEYRVDSTGIVHVAAGKVSFGGEKITSNLKAILESLKTNKPASLKAAYVRSIYLTTSMGPSIQVNVSELNA